MENRKNEELIQLLARNNSPIYNEDKLIEEISEVLEVISKRRTKAKTPDMPTMRSLVEELGDLQLRLAIYIEQLGVGPEVKNRIRQKLIKYETYTKDKKYSGRI